MNNEAEFRLPTAAEFALLTRLLEADFPGREELSSSLDGIKVRALDVEGSYEIKTLKAIRAPVLKQIPVEAEATDTDGVLVHLLLRVVDGVLSELEIYKDDGSPIREMPAATSFELMVLPPIPD